ncbi:MAG: translocation/assembly module TamB domain-containing protein [Cytophagaceae bacterium]
MKRIFNLLLKFLLYPLTFILGLLVILFILIHIPAFQKWSGRKLSGFLSNQLQTDVSIDALIYNPFSGELSLNEGYVLDEKSDTLMRFGRLNADFSYSALLSNKIFLKDISLEEGKLVLIREKGEQDFNLNKLLANLAADTVAAEAGSGDWEFRINSVRLNNINLEYTDLLSGLYLSVFCSECIGLFEDLPSKYNKVLTIEEVTGKDFTGYLEIFEKTGQSESDDPLEVVIRQMDLRDGRFHYKNLQASAPHKGGINYSDILAKNLSAGITDLKVHDNGFYARVNSLGLTEQSGFVLQNLSGALDIKDTNLLVNITQIITPASDFTGRIDVIIPGFQNIEHNVESISANAQFSQDSFAQSDIAYFLPEANQVPQIKNRNFTVDGKLSGIISDFRFENALVKLDKSNYFSGNIRLKGLPDVTSLQLDVSMQPLMVHSKFLTGFIAGTDTLPVIIEKLGQIHTTGRVHGSFRDFKINTTHHTGLGKASPDLRVLTDKDNNPFYVTGTIQTEGFNVGRLVRQDMNVKDLTVDLKVTSDLKQHHCFAGLVKSVTLENKNLSNIRTCGTITDEVVKGILDIDDPALHANIAGEYNISNQHVSGSAYVQKIRLDEFMALDDTTELSFISSVNISNFHPDSLESRVLIKDLDIHTSGLQYTNDSILVQATIEEGLRRLSIFSEDITGYLRGYYTFQELPDAAIHLLSHYFEAFRDRDTHSHVRYAEFGIESKDLSPLANIFYPAFTQLGPTQIRGSFHKENHELLVDLYAARIKVGEREINELRVQAEGDENQLTLAGELENFHFNDSLILRNFTIDGYVEDSEFNFQSMVSEYETNSSLRLDAVFAYESDTFNLLINHADLILQGQRWKVEDRANVVFTNDFLSVTNLELSQRNQYIGVNAHTTVVTDEIDLSLRDVEINPFLSFTGLDHHSIFGKVSGTVRLNDVFDLFGLTADLRIQEVAVDTVRLGNIKVNLRKEPGRPEFALNTEVSGEGNSANLSGIISGNDKREILLDLRADIAYLSIAPLQSFLNEIFFSLKGNISSTLTLKGTVSRPVINGRMLFAGKNILGLRLTGTEYIISNQEIEIDNNNIAIRNLVFHDHKGNRAMSYGNVRIDDVDNIFFDLNLNANNFYVMDSEEVNEAGFYGTLISDLSVSMTGPIQNVRLNLNMNTLPGTRIFIPLLTDQLMETPDYIIFVSPEVELEKQEDRAKLPITEGPRLHLLGNLNVTKDAEINIVVDPVNGDMITARGSGLLRLDFDTQNLPLLYGTYTISEGEYTFSFIELIQKQFTIQEGSTITWNGEIENGLLDVTAIYRTRASTADLVQDYFVGNPGTVRVQDRRLPVLVYLKIGGQIEDPELGFDIDIPEGEQLTEGGLVMQKLNEIRNDPQELEEQVFGLVVMDRFMTVGGTGTWGGGPGGGDVVMTQAGQSVSRVLNRTLNQLTPEVLGGFEINVNVNALTTQGAGLAQNVQVSATKEISERLAVTAGGQVAVGNVANAGQFVGDYTLTYRLNPSGSLMIRLFRTSYQYLFLEELQTRTGASIQHRRGFDSFRGLFRKENDNN